MAEVEGMLQDVVEECLYFEKQVVALKEALGEERLHQSQAVSSLERYARQLEDRCGGPAADLVGLKAAASAARSAVSTHDSGMRQRLAGVGILDLDLVSSSISSSSLSSGPAGSPSSSMRSPRHGGASTPGGIAAALERERATRENLEREVEMLRQQIQMGGGGGGR